jgi:hypothetical protein
MKELVYLDTYPLQKDMRIRLPKSVLENFNIKEGKTNFKIYCDKENKQLILKIDNISNEKRKSNDG